MSDASSDELFEEIDSEVPANGTDSAEEIPVWWGDFLKDRSISAEKWISKVEVNLCLLPTKRWQR